MYGVNINGGAERDRLHIYHEQLGGLALTILLRLRGTEEIPGL